MSAAIVRVCVCGVTMAPTPKGSTAKWCLNCDAVQPQEMGENHKPRVITSQDRRFHLAWEQMKRVYFGGAK